MKLLVMVGLFKRSYINFIRSESSDSLILFFSKNNNELI